MPNKPTSLKNRRFGRWYVEEKPPIRSKDGTHTYWSCICDCGTSKNVRADQMLNGVSKSCGCLHAEISSTHKQSGTRLYLIHHGMKSRCESGNKWAWNCYGARGIKICRAWEKFENFKKDMEESYKEHVDKYGEKNTTIDRIDNTGNYCKRNCRWATYKVQANNRRTTYLTGEPK